MTLIDSSGVVPEGRGVSAADSANVGGKKRKRQLLIFLFLDEHT